MTIAIEKFRIRMKTEFLLRELFFPCTALHTCMEKHKMRPEHSISPRRPCIRREKHSAASFQTGGAGSSPHMRGKLIAVIQVDVQRRITPAYAGKSPAPAHTPTFRRDHPRIRGEKIISLFYLPRQGGSPPHTRGKVESTLAQYRKLGITPAYAGKSYLAFRTAYTNKDHPRIRGEKSGDMPMRSRTSGSPPHTRGKAASPTGYQRYLRITPAYAGKSKLEGRLVASLGDHPRIRGEKADGRRA